MRDPITVVLPSSDDQLTSSSIHHILYDIQVGKDIHIPYPVLPSPVGSDEPHFSAGASTMSGSSTSPPSLCENTDEYAINPAHASAFASSYASDYRRPILTPLSITQGPRYDSPWSSVDAPTAYTNLRRGSLPTLALDHALQDPRPFTAPQEHIYAQQHHQTTSWSDQDDLSRFAYSGYDSPTEDPPLSALSNFSPIAPSPRRPEFIVGSPRLDDDFSRSRPPTRDEYPAYIPDCQETIHAESSQQYLVNPSAVFGPLESIPSPPEAKPPVDQFVQPPASISDTSRTITPSPSTKRKRSSTKEKLRTSPIIETFKDGIVPPIKRRGKLPKATTELLKCWLYEHAQHPYPTEEEKRHLCSETGLTFNQVSNWMINARRRILPARNAASLGCLKPSPHSRGCNLPTSSGSLNEHYQFADPSISGHPHQNAASSSSAWEHQPCSTPPQTSPPTTFYSNQHLQPYTTSSADSSAQSGSLVGCVTTSQFLPYGLNGGGNPFNYHGSTDSNILSRTFIDSKQFLGHSYPSTLERTQMLKREQAVEPPL